jgi:hypothetical protein
MNFELWKWTGLLSTFYNGGKKSITWYLFYCGRWYFWHPEEDSHYGWNKCGFTESSASLRYWSRWLREDNLHIQSSPLEFLVQTGTDFYKTLEDMKVEKE